MKCPHCSKTLYESNIMIEEAVKGENTIWEYHLCNFCCGTVLTYVWDVYNNVKDDRKNARKIRPKVMCDGGIFFKIKI